MARIAGVDVPRDKRVVISLTYIFGIGKTTAQSILNAADISQETRVREPALRKSLEKRNLSTFETKTYTAA